MKLRRVFIVYDENHGMVGIYANEQSAKNVVENISVECYGMKTEDEIWSADYKNGNELVYYREEEVQW